MGAREHVRRVLRQHCQVCQRISRKRAARARHYGFQQQLHGSFHLAVVEALRQAVLRRGRAIDITVDVAATGPLGASLLPCQRWGAVWHGSHVVHKRGGQNVC